MLDQKKKVLLLGGAFVLLLIGVSVFLFATQSNKTAQIATPPAASRPMTPPSPPRAAPTRTPARPGTPASMPARPGMPPNMPARPGTQPGMAVRPGMPGANNAAALAALTPPRQYVDPFVGWTRIVPQPKTLPNGIAPIPPGAVPSIELPGVHTSGEAGGGGGTNNNNNNNRKKPPPELFMQPTPLSISSLGRYTGWISDGESGTGTAYFQQSNGKIISIEVGSVVNGLRITALSKEYIVLRDEATGREEQVRLNANQQLSSGYNYDSTNEASN